MIKKIMRNEETTKRKREKISRIFNRENLEIYCSV